MDTSVSVTFLIGNGFDLNCGLKTKYSDTYDSYLKSPSHTKNIQLFKKVMQDEISHDIDNWSDFEMALAKHAESFYSLGCLFDGLTDYTEFLGNYLLEQNNAFNKQIEKAPLSFSGSAILHHFYKGFPSQTENNMFSEMFMTPFINYSVLNFNYTNTIDTLLSRSPGGLQSKIKVPILHVHGTINEGMILGVNDVEQLHLTKELTEREKRTIVKPFFNKIFDDTKTDRAMQLIKDSDVLCIYGLSLGESDQIWRNTIIEWTRNNPEHHIILYDYKLENETTHLANKKLNLAEDSRNIFFEYLFEKKDKEVKKQIHIPVGHSFFDFRKRIALIESIDSKE